MKLIAKDAHSSLNTFVEKWFKQRFVNLITKIVSSCRLKVQPLHSIFIIALYTISQNGSKNVLTLDTQSKFMKSCRKFKNNMDNLQYNFLNFSPDIRCTEIVITAWFTPKQVSSLQKFITFTLDLKWRPKTPIWKY